MSLLLCRQEKVERPYYVRELGLSIYSSQELCYCILNYPLLLMDSLICESLLEFMSSQLDLGYLVFRIERLLKSGSDPDEPLFVILQECDYCTPAEVSRFRQQAAELRQKHPAEFRMQKAQALFQAGQYARAAAIYREVLDLPKDRTVDDAFAGRAAACLGACFARLFRFGRAAKAYRLAYAKTADEALLEKICILMALDPDLDPGERIRELITEEKRTAAALCLQEARAQADSADALRAVEEIFDKDSRRLSEIAGAQLKKWREEYRTMC